ncbi:MAG TPA: ferritin [Cyanobacteria bacterium UBA8530]|nr:ferritin [Cyanobacteria bacterium UBA8530]
MLKEKVENSINRQIQAEVYSSYLYMAMTAYATHEGLTGTANWLKVQAQEELTHALRFYQYVNQRGGRVILLPIEQPPSDFHSMPAIFEAVLKHEEYVTSLINGLVDIAQEEKDHATVQMLQWFVTEQVEEEANANDILNRLKLIGKDGSTLFMLDKDLGTRVFTPPPDMVI